MGLSFAGGSNNLPTDQEIEAERQRLHEAEMAELRRREIDARRRIEEAKQKIKTIRRERGESPNRSR